MKLSQQKRLIRKLEKQVFDVANEIRNKPEYEGENYFSNPYLQRELNDLFNWQDERLKVLTNQIAFERAVLHPFIRKHNIQQIRWKNRKRKRDLEVI